MRSVLGSAACMVPWVDTLTLLLKQMQLTLEKIQASHEGPKFKFPKWKLNFDKSKWKAP